MNINVLEFLMENDVVIKTPNGDRFMTADAMYELDGEFVVYHPNIGEDLYRGDDFEDALRILLNGK